MAFEIVAEDDELNAAFAVIERKLNEGFQFNNNQKDLGIKLSFDALPDAERGWFVEICIMNRIRFWQCLWGQFRRTREWGMAQAPLLDPGWQEDGSGVAYSLEDRECGFCHQVFKPTDRGQTFCSNECGAKAEREKLNAKYEQDQIGREKPKPVEPEEKTRRKPDLEMNPARLFEGLGDKQAMVDDTESVQLPDDYAEVN